MTTHTVGDFTYTLNVDLTANPSTFVGSGDMGTYVASFSTNGQTYNVKLEGEGGFKNMTSKPPKITIPPGITHIGYRYFYNAYSQLTHVYFSHDMTIDEKICQSAHSLNYFPFEHIIGTIRISAFEGCYYLDTTHINIAKATSIEKYAFYRVGNWADTTDKATITLGDSVTSIHIDAFYEVDRLAKVTFGANVPDINAFKRSTIISMVFNGTTVPAGTNVAHYANVEVYAPNIADTTPFHAYGFSPSNIYTTDTVHPVITLTGGEAIFVSKYQSFTDPGFSAFDGIDGDVTSSVVVTGTVDTSAIGTYTITYDVSDSLGNAGQKTRTVYVLSSYPYVSGDFAYRLNLDTNSAFPAAFVGSGDTGTFVSTINVTELNQTFTVKLEGEAGFKNITGTNKPKKVTIPPEITNIGYRYFYNANGQLTHVYFSHDMTIDDAICQSTHSLLHFPFEHIIGTIGKYAFEGCTALDTTNINIAKASYIDKSAFLNVGRYSDITEKGTIIFGDSVTYIDSGAFGWDEKIHHATFGANVPDINAFKLNTTIETMTFTGTTVPAGTYVANYANITVFAPNIADTTPFHAYGFSPANINQFASVPTLIADPTATSVETTNISSQDLTDTAVIGVTPVEQRSFAKQSVFKIFDKNPAATTGKSLVLKAGAVLPGFSTSLAQDTVLVDGRTSKSLNTGDILNRAFYVPMEDNVTITLGSLNDNVSITQVDSTTFNVSASLIGSVTKTSGSSLLYDGLDILFGSIYGSLSVPVICFKEGTKITCMDEQTKEEVELPIETIKPNTFVKTYKHGFMKAKKVAYRPIENLEDDSIVKNRLYICEPEKFSALTEPLIMTGCHALLVDTITDKQRAQMVDQLGEIYVTDDKYRLLCMYDENVKPYKEGGRHNVWHICLEHFDEDMNYGIYANGLLVESCSERNMRKEEYCEVQ